MERMKWEYSPIHLTFTTGRSALPTMFVYTKYDIERLKRAVSRAYEVVGIKTDYRCVSTFPYAPHLAFLGAWEALEHLGIFTFHTGGGKILGTQRIIDAIEAMKPEIITCIPGYGYHMLRTAKSQGRDFSSVKVVITGAEKVPLGMKKKMTEMLEAMGAHNPRIIGLYGFTEARTFWAECSSMGQEGYHIYPDMDLIEIVDPKTGERVEEGEGGEIVYTPLDGRGSMVLRYGTGDIAQNGLVWDECPHCGRLMPRLSSDIRRSSEIKEFNLTKVKGTLVDLNAFVAIVSNFETIEEWQAEIRKKNDDPYELDEFYIHVAPKKGVDFDDLKKSLMAEIVRETEVAPTDIRYCELDEILGMLGMETELKEKRIVDNRPKN